MRYRANFTFEALDRLLLPCAVGACFAALSAGDALAAEAAKGPSEVVFLFQLIVLLLFGRLLGELMQQVGQPSVMGQLIAGIILGPSVFGWAFPDLQHALFPRTPEQKAMIDGISQFGILLLLLLTGMETDLRLVRKVGKAAISISISGVAVPFICGFTLGQFMPDWLLPHPDQRLLTSLFLGTALSISSIKVLATIVREMGFTRRNLGQVIVASAICEDTIGWVIIAITFSLAEAGTIDLISVGKSILGTAVFLLVSFTVGRRIVFFLIRWANDNFKSDFPVVTVILIIMGAMALVTHFIGVHTVLGAFIAGVLVGESPILSKHIDEQVRGLILGFFMPVFFGMAGLSTDLTVLKDPNLLVMALVLIAIASVGKFAGAFFGGAVGGLTRRESLALACGMNARGSTEVIVASIGLSMGALSQNLFTMIVAMAVVTTMAMPPMLRWGLARVPLGKKEKARLEREKFEAKGFVPNLERLLLAVDESPNGRFASRLAGLIAGQRGLPITVLPWQKSKPSNMKTTGIIEEETDPAAAAKAAAERTGKAKQDESAPAAPDVTVRVPDKAREEAIKEEALKGYDLLFIGVEHTKKRGGGFHADVARAAAAFDGPLALVVGNSSMLEHGRECPCNILVPVTGTEVSNRAAEVAIALGRACNASVTALYVSSRRANEGTRRRPLRSRRQQQAILKEIVEIADRYEFDIKTAMRTNVAPDNAIISAAKRGGHDLIIMGVNRRASDGLDFGDTAAAVLEKAESSTLYLAD
jgi:Kef-type K+ transport system membrane component KefB/nucleotide-binding universal stress UspA family protein